MINTKELKKIELHIHLDGSLREETVKEILNKNVDLKASEKCLDLNEYLTKFDVPISIMQTKEILTRISKELVEDLVSDNVIYAEIRFAPIFHTKGGLTLDEVVESVLKGLNNDKLYCNLILCMMRGQSFENNLKIIDLAKRYHLPIDLAGAEGIYKTENYKELFEIAFKKNIQYTIHSGEADSSSSLKSAIDFKTKRIGHGIRAIENEHIINEIIKNDITLEVCPTSNVQTNVVDEYKNHPIKKLMEIGVKVTVNTDNRTVSNVTLSDEYDKLVKYFNFTKEDFYILNKNAIEAAFLPTEIKQKIMYELDKSYNN